MFFEKTECLASTYKSGGLSDKLPKCYLTQSLKFKKHQKNCSQFSSFNLDILSYEGGELSERIMPNNICIGGAYKIWKLGGENWILTNNFA